MKPLYPNSSVLHIARKLVLALPICFLLQFYSYYNKANAGVIISQVYATNGAVGSTYNASFIQLFNLSGSPVNINGWSIQWRGSSGNYIVIALPNVTIPPYQAFLIGGQVYTNGAALPTPIFSSPTLDLPLAIGKVILMPTTTVIPANSCPAAGSYIDMFGYGSTNCYIGSPFPALTNTRAAIRNSVINVSNLTSYTSFIPMPFSFPFAGALAGGSTLPISLIKFSAHNDKVSNIIEWTASIDGPSSFDIERSENGIDFSSITVVFTIDLGTKSFSFTDKNIATQKEFYRLKMTDESGVITYSSVVVVTNETKSKSIARLYPTIVSKQLSLTFAGSENMAYTIIAIDGKIMKTGNVQATMSQIEINTFAQGQYFVHLKNKQGDIQVLRFVKK